MFYAALFLTAILAGSLVYCGLVVAAVWRYRGRRAPVPSDMSLADARGSERLRSDVGASEFDASGSEGLKLRASGSKVSHADGSNVLKCDAGGSEGLKSRASGSEVSHVGGSNVLKRADDRHQPISVLKPLAGYDLGLEENLRSFFAQDYPAFDVLFAVRELDDAAVGVVRKLQAEYPRTASRLIVTGEPPYPNAKVYSLDLMMRAARYDLLVMSDSDIRVDASMLRVVAAEFNNPEVDLATCPYRAIGGPSLWSRLEAVGMDTEFWGGVLVARMLEGMKFAVGPTIVARKAVLERIGGFDLLKDYLAEDFVMGSRAAQAGAGVILSSYVVEHRIGSHGLRVNFAHRLRWARSTRRSRPAGYIGQVFTNPLPLALLMVAIEPSWWPALLLACIMRAAAAHAVAVNALGAQVSWALLPVQDVLSFAFWIAGFFGNTIHWRGRVYRLLRDGRFELADTRAVNTAKAARP
jgi:ceramide glucosyltransferase